MKMSYVCQECGHSVAKWVGKCPECCNWNSFEEQGAAACRDNIRGCDALSREHPSPVSEISIENYKRVVTGISEFDRVVGGGIAQASLALIGGEPGVGKSTLLTMILGKIAKENPRKNILYVSGEESKGQVADRCRRLGVQVENLYIVNETNWESIRDHLKKLKPMLMVLDSIQTTSTSEIQSAPGTVSQIREVTYELMNYSKGNSVTCFVVGHITKEGSIAGPKILEHMVDTVIYFEGDQYGHYRMLRSIKNRFGNNNEVGIFEMKERGLEQVINPSQYFLDDQLNSVFGRSVSCILEGSRSLFIEVQALCVENKAGVPRRTTQGIDLNRLSMLVAIVEKYIEESVGFNDIYLNVIGGMKISNRETDLSVIASLLSSYRGKPFAEGTLFIGEVGLTGEVRPAPRMEKRIKEMAHLKYKRLFTSKKIAKEFDKKYPIEIIGINNVKELNNFL
jgi:DNA repair protein RadA/Sms